MAVRFGKYFIISTFGSLSEIFFLEKFFMHASFFSKKIHCFGFIFEKDFVFSSCYLPSHCMFNLPAYHDDVVLWFSLLDSYFKVNKIDPQLLLDIVRGGMLPLLARSVWELITNPSAYLTYDTLKIRNSKMEHTV